MENLFLGLLLEEKNNMLNWFNDVPNKYII